VSYVAYASVTDDDRRQRPLLVWPPYTMCRRASNKLSTSNPGANLTPNGGDLLDDNATPGYSRSVMYQCQASDSPGALVRIIEGRRYGHLLPTRYDDDDDDGGRSG